MRLPSLCRVRPALVGALAATLFAAGAAAQRTEPLPKELEGVGITEVPGARIPLDLDFVDEHGARVRLGDYFARGKPVILTLNYYRCPMLCGLMLNGLLDGLRELAWQPGDQFEIVTVSIDPSETPTLARLKKESFMEELGRPGAAAGWHFLVGQPESITPLAEAVGFQYRYDEQRKEYIHAAGVFVAMADGRVARYLYGLIYEGRTLRLALAEAAEGTVGSSVDRLLLYCFHYDANQGRYVVAATNVMRLGGAATVVVVGAWLAAWWRRTSRREKSDAEERTT